MQPLHFVEVHEDGKHLVLIDPSAPETEYLLEIDERLRSAVRTRPQGPAAASSSTEVSPRRVQAMMRAGQSPEEIAEATGWPVDRVRRFEGPIIAEREHVADRARRAHVRGRTADGGVPTLEARVRERLQARGVDADQARWDATRPDGGQWTVLVSFTAGHRERNASWRFEPAGSTVEALDDEARWLSEDEQVLPGGADAVLGGPRTSGMDLVTTMRERSQARGRRGRRPAEPGGRQGGKGRGRANPSALPSPHDTVPDELLPLEDLPYDPETMGPPPAAGRAGPTDEGPDEVTAPQPHAEPVDDDALDDDAGADDMVDEVPDDELAAEGAVELPAGGPVDEAPQDTTLDDFFGFDEVTEEDVDAEDESVDEIDEDQSVGGFDEEPASEEPAAAADDSAEPEPQPDPEPEPAPEPAPQPDPEPDDRQRRSTKRKGRPSVPSWDDIMFGTRKS